VTKLICILISEGRVYRLCGVNGGIKFNLNTCWHQL